MVLDISNEITILCDNHEQIANIYNKYFNGKDINCCKIRSMNENMIIAWVYSVNSPLVDLPQEILQNYTDVWIKLEWSCESGKNGICVGGYKSNVYYPYKVFDWVELCIEERYSYLTESNKRLRT